MFFFSGKDITHKLYSVSEGLGAGAGSEREGTPAHLTRSASVDAVHEGARGKLRSLAWRARSTTTKGYYYLSSSIINILCEPRP